MNVLLFPLKALTRMEKNQADELLNVASSRFSK